MNLFKSVKEFFKNIFSVEDQIHPVCQESLNKKGFMTREAKIFYKPQEIHIDNGMRVQFSPSYKTEFKIEDLNDEQYRKLPAIQKFNLDQGNIEKYSYYVNNPSISEKVAKDYIAQSKLVEAPVKKKRNYKKKKKNNENQSN